MLIAELVWSYCGLYMRGQTDTSIIDIKTKAHVWREHARAVVFGLGVAIVCPYIEHCDISM